MNKKVRFKDLLMDALANHGVVADDVVLFGKFDHSNEHTIDIAELASVDDSKEILIRIIDIKSLLNSYNKALADATSCKDRLANILAKCEQEIAIRDIEIMSLRGTLNKKTMGYATPILKGVDDYIANVEYFKKKG